MTRSFIIVDECTTVYRSNAEWHEQVAWSEFVTLRGGKYSDLKACKKAARQRRSAAKRQLAAFKVWNAVRRLTK